MKQIHLYYNKQIMVFIDEYDTPFIEAYANGFYENVKIGLNNIYQNTLKDNNSLNYALLTGIQRVAKENIFSGLNNLEVHDVSSHFYDEYFGFCEDEVKEMMAYYKLEFNDEIKDMYDGYCIGNQHIYNPWSILSYIKHKELKPYWINTSTNHLLRSLLKNANSRFKEEYHDLIINGHLNTAVNLSSSFYEMNNNSSLWGLFVSAGYLTLDSKKGLRIPNKEVVDEFKSITTSYLNIEDVDTKNFIKGIINKDKELFIKAYKNMLKIPSFYDLSSENSYHMFLLGISIWLKGDYEIISNKEEGKGRCNLILKSRKALPNYIFEFKYSKSEKNLDSLAKQAINQIKEREYDYNLGDEVVYVGLAHYKKEVKIIWQEGK